MLYTLIIVLVPKFCELLRLELELLALTLTTPASAY